MNRKQKRRKIIDYFLRINQGQEEVQVIQNKLISHIRFNPLIIYSKIAVKSQHPKKTDLINFIQQIIKDNNHIQLIKIYVNKHFHNEVITLQEFSSTLLPYTPNILRNVSQTIDKQMQTKHFDRVIHQLYVNMVQIQVQSIYQICLLQGQINMEWSQIKKMILKDLEEKAKKIDLHDQTQFSVMTIRKWMELWIQIHQYKILNILRWFGGFQEQRVKKIYDSMNLNLKCTCSESSNTNNLSAQQSKTINLHQNSIFSKKITIRKVKSTESLIPDTHNYLKFFSKYLQAIVNSQRKLQILNSQLKPYRKQVELILHEITNKKSNYTKAKSIISQIQKSQTQNQAIIQKLYEQLHHTKFDNNLIFSLFAKEVNTIKLAKKILKEQVLQYSLSVLYTFCLSRATLKAIAKDLYFGVEYAFKQLDQNNKLYLDMIDLRLIMKDFRIKFKEHDLVIMMSHLGDGEIITLQTLKSVLRTQKDN